MTSARLNTSVAHKDDRADKSFACRDEVLLDGGAQLEPTRFDGGTAIMLAAASTQPELVPNREDALLSDVLFSLQYVVLQ